MTESKTRIAAVAMHSEMGNFRANLAAVSKWCHRARSEGADFALFPEECITGSLNKSDLNIDDARKIVHAAEAESLPWLESLTRELEMTVVVGTIESAGERFANNALIIGPHGHIATFTKLHLPNAVEKEWFISGDLLPIVRSQGWTFGVGICYDLRFPEIFRTAAQHGADFFLLAVGGSGGHPAPEDDQRSQITMHKNLAMQLMPARAVDNALYIFYANQAGHSGNAYFPGFSLAVAPQGALIDEHLCGEGMTVTEISRTILDQARRSGAFTAAETRPEIYAAAALVGEREEAQIR